MSDEKPFEAEVPRWGVSPPGTRREGGIAGRLVRSRALYVLVGLTGLAFVLMRWGEAAGGPTALWERFGWWGPALSVPFHAVIAVTPFPSDLVGMANGAVYGFGLGTALSWLGWFLASALQYAIGRRAGRELDVQQWLGRAPAWIRRFPVDHPLFLILGRFVPYVGGHLVTLVPGALHVSLRRYAWCTALALVPQSLLTAGLGAGLVLLGG